MITRRDYFAAHADVSWIATASIPYACAKADTNPPPPNPTDNQLSNFWIRVELKWRWKFADLMVSGKGD